MIIRLALLLGLTLLCGACSAAPAHSDVASLPQVDRSCRVDADCMVKDVGNCCGYYPACVNRDSPTFAEQVRQQCEKSGSAGICGFPEIEGCVCTNGQCAAQGTRAQAPAQTQ